MSTSGRCSERLRRHDLAASRLSAPSRAPGVRVESRFLVCSRRRNVKGSDFYEDLPLRSSSSPGRGRARRVVPGSLYFRSARSERYKVIASAATEAMKYCHDDRRSAGCGDLGHREVRRILQSLAVVPGIRSTVRSAGLQACLGRERLIPPAPAGHTAATTPAVNTRSKAGGNTAHPKPGGHTAAGRTRPRDAADEPIRSMLDGRNPRSRSPLTTVNQRR